MGKKFLDVVKKIKEAEGVCSGIKCSECPFSKSNNGLGKNCIEAGFASHHSSRNEDYKLMYSCEEYLKNNSIKVGDIVKIRICGANDSAFISDVGFHFDVSKFHKGECWEVMYTDLVIPSAVNGIMNDTIVKSVVTERLLSISSYNLMKLGKHRVLGLSDMFDALIEHGYKPTKEGGWKAEGSNYFSNEMWYTCGKEPSERFAYEPWMLEDA